MNKLIATALLGAAISAPAMASQDNISDASKIFKTDSNSMQLVVLSSAEMQKTEGAFLNFRSQRSFSHRGIFGQRQGGRGFNSSLRGFSFGSGFSSNSIFNQFNSSRNTGFSWF